MENIESNNLRIIITVIYQRKIEKENGLKANLLTKKIFITPLKLLIIRTR